MTLRPSQRETLQALAKAEDGMTITELAEAVGCGPATMRHRVRILDARGLVERFFVARLHAPWSYRLTEAGKEAIQ